MPLGDVSVWGCHQHNRDWEYKEGGGEKEELHNDATKDERKYILGWTEA